MAKTVEEKAIPLTEDVTHEQLAQLTDQVVKAIDQVVGERSYVTQMTVVLAALARYITRTLEAGLPMRIVAGFVEPLAMMVGLKVERPKETKH